MPARNQPRSGPAQSAGEPLPGASPAKKERTRFATKAPWHARKKPVSVEELPGAGQELVAQAHELAAVFEGQARASEELRRPADEAIAALRDSDILRMMVPEAYGGLGLDMDTFVEVILVLAESDASLAWVTSFYTEHNWMFALFPESFQREFFEDRNFVLAPAAISPAGGAERVEGGYRLSGRWSWATGVMHGEWAIVGGLTAGADGGIEGRFFALDQADLRIEDVWFVDGMSGTGSNDVVIDNLVVPEERSVSIQEACEGRAPGASVHDGLLYRTPMFPLLTTAAGMPVIGQARRQVREFGKRMQERRLMSGKLQAESQNAQVTLAEVEVAAHGAELLLRDAVRELCALRERATRADRARLRARIATAVHRARDVIDTISRASGASAHRLDSPIQRALRDANTMTGHVVFDLPATYQVHGRALLGDEPELPFV